MTQSDESRIDVEISRLRSEYMDSIDARKSSQLYSAMQALTWALRPEEAVAPTWCILVGKVQPITDTLAG